MALRSPKFSKKERCQKPLAPEASVLMGLDTDGAYGGSAQGNPGLGMDADRT